MQLAIAKDFLAEYAKLEKPVRNAVHNVISRFQEHTHAGLHLERVKNARDARIRTIRVDKFWRGVVLAPEKGDVYLLLTVLPHDDAYAYCAGHRFTVNQRLGVFEVRDEVQLSTMEPALRRAASIERRRLFEGIKDSDLKRLGIDEQILPVIRLLTREAHLEAMQHLLPAVQYEALFALASGMTVEETWAEVSKNLVDSSPPASVDPDDLASALARTPERVVFVEGPAELTRILARPFDAWRIFLHPQQRKFAYRPTFMGPAMITGGAGTGKTVTALHRAAYLAQRYERAERPPILLTTFTNTLVTSLGRQLDCLVDDPRIRARIDVVTTDKIAREVLQKSVTHVPRPLHDKELRSRWEKVARDLGVPYSGTFLVSEWTQVILANRIATEAEYLEWDRRGREKPVGSSQRRQIWHAIAHALTHMRGDHVASFLQLADEAARVLETTGRPIYEHIVVDEAQDLHPAQWRLLRAAVADKPDDFFIAGDPHQRIYDNRVSLHGMGIRVRGRSRRLTLSYRTTQEILSWAVHLLDPDLPITGLDGGADTLAGYGSPMHGRRPIVRRFPDREAELDALVAHIRSWLADGVEPHAIGIAARVSTLVEQVRDVLTAARIPAGRVDGGAGAVPVCTMHAMKGLEFRCVAVVGAEADQIPLPLAVPPAHEDQAAHDQALLRERCLLFVACTRARDALYVSYSGSATPFLPR